MLPYKSFATLGKKKSGMPHLQKSLKLYQPNFSASSNSNLHAHTHPSHKRRHTLSLSMHHCLSRQSSSVTHYCLLNSFMRFEPTSYPSPSQILSASDITLTLPHCPTYKWREGAGRGKETGVDGGEDEADGSRGSINSLSS